MMYETPLPSQVQEISQQMATKRPTPAVVRMKRQPTLIPRLITTTEAALMLSRAASMRSHATMTSHRIQTMVRAPMLKAATTAMATAWLMQTATVYAMHLKWPVARTQRLATTMLTRQTKTARAPMLMPVTTAMATAS